MYPIFDLRHFTTDLHWYLRSLEEIVIRALKEVSDIDGTRIPGLTGVWVDGKKVAAMGVRATRWVTYHGLALNVTTDLRPFQKIVPCGIVDKPVASILELLADQSGDIISGDIMDNALYQRQLMEEYRYGLIDAAEQVFGIEFQKEDINYH